MINQVAYILTYRKSNPTREHNLKTLIGYLFRNFGFELEAHIVEQDSQTRFDVNLPSNFKHTFVPNSGFFNRSWGLNVGAKISNKPILIFGDADTLLKPDLLVDAITSVNNDVESLRPYQTWIWMNENDSLAFNREYNFDSINQDNLSLEAGPGAGMLIVRRALHERCGGWDERFEGWGPEDTAYAHKLMLVGTYEQAPYTLYHLYHERTSGEFPGGHSNYVYMEHELKKEVTQLTAQDILKDAEACYGSCGKQDKYLKV